MDVCSSVDILTAVTIRSSETVCTPSFEDKDRQYKQRKLRDKNNAKTANGLKKTIAESSGTCTW